MAYFMKMPRERCTSHPNCRFTGAYKVVGGFPRSIYRNVCSRHGKIIEARCTEEEIAAGIDPDTLAPVATARAQNDRGEGE